MKSDQNFNANWYEIWMKQSREFYETAEKNFKDTFGKGGMNPEEHMEKIRQWQETLRNTWQFNQLNEQMKPYEKYWNEMAQMCNQAAEKMVQVWIKRSQENDPVKSVRELYDIWLDCCNEIYKKAMQSQQFQQAYGEFMNAALKFWKTTTPK